MSRNHASEPQIFSNLLIKLPELRNLGARHTAHLDWFRMNWTKLTLPPLFAEIFDIPKSEDDLQWPRRGTHGNLNNKSFGFVGCPVGDDLKIVIAMDLAVTCLYLLKMCSKAEYVWENSNSESCMETLHQSVIDRVFKLFLYLVIKFSFSLFYWHIVIHIMWIISVFTYLFVNIVATFILKFWCGSWIQYIFAFKTIFGSTMYSSTYEPGVRNCLPRPFYFENISLF